MAKQNKTIKKQGRPSKLTPELRREFFSLIMAGNYIEVACGTVGIDKSTYYDWMKRGEESKKSTIYGKFYKEMKYALAFSQARLVAIIKKAAKTDWRAAAWLLERRYPESWGKKKNTRSYHWDSTVDVDNLDGDSNTKDLLRGKTIKIQTKFKPNGPLKPEDVLRIHNQILQEANFTRKN